jgi:hypothetical protein
MLSVFKVACFTVVDEYILHFNDRVANLWSIQKLAGKIVHICMYVNNSIKNLWIVSSDDTKSILKILGV